MAFGWFGKKSSGDKALDRARKLAAQGRWAEALSYYEEAGDAGEDARRGARTCRQQLVDANLDEAEGLRRAGELDRAREHILLARDLAGEEADLRERADEALTGLGGAPPPSPGADSPERRFPPTCGCEAPCDPPSPETAGAQPHPEDLFAFYLETMAPEERAVLEPLDARFREGFVWLQQGEAERARPILEEVLATSPDAPGVQYSLGHLHALEGDPDAAAERFTATLALAPGFGPAVHHRAQALREAGQPEQAAAGLETWLSDHPDDAEAWFLLAACRIDTGGLDRAVEAADNGERHADEGEVRHWILRARAFRDAGRPDDALAELQAVAARRPDLLEALVPLGQLLVEKGGTAAERAAEVFKHCLRLDPDRGWWYLLRLAEAYAARGWLDEAREVLGRARAGLPDRDDARADHAAVEARLAGR